MKIPKVGDTVVTTSPFRTCAEDESILDVPAGTACTVEKRHLYPHAQGLQFFIQPVEIVGALSFALDETDLIDGEYPFDLIEAL